MNNNHTRDISWFRPLLGGNSPTSSEIILKKNKCHKGSTKCSSGSHIKGGMDLVTST
jgi:hypothetical protein